MLAPNSYAMHTAPLTDPTVKPSHPIQNIIRAAVALPLDFRTHVADQCPLTILSGLVPSLLFGLEPVFSSPCVIFSIKLM